jgi:hypothetical protein
MTWAYDNGVSQPLSTAILMGSSGQEQSIGQLFSASSWAKAWHAANHISPVRLSPRVPTRRRGR